MRAEISVFFWSILKEKKHQGGKKLTKYLTKGCTQKLTNPLKGMSINATAVSAPQEALSSPGGLEYTATAWDSAQAAAICSMPLGQAVNNSPCSNWQGFLWAGLVQKCLSGVQSGQIIKMASI